ncbi:MAG: ATP-binding cassette domain-containing protein [Vicinamibacterales bacterium]
MPLFEVSGLTRAYHRGEEHVPALCRASPAPSTRGQFVVLAGPSGSGKSTLLHLLGGLDRPDEGDVRFDGLSLGDASESARTTLRRHAIGFVFEAFNLVPVLSAFENVE